MWLTQSLFQQRVYFILSKENRIMFCFNSLMCTIGRWKGCFCHPELVNRADFQAWPWLAWIHIVIGTEEGATTAHFNPPPLPKCTIQMEKYLTQLTRLFLRQREFFILYNGNDIVFCFNHSLMCIIGCWKGFICCPESAKRGNFQACLWRAWIGVLVGTEEGETTSYFIPPTNVRCKWLNIWLSWHSRFCNKGYFLCYVKKIKSCFALILH